jgi:hypothetical protein
VADNGHRPKVIRARTPPRGRDTIEGRQTLWTLQKEGGQPIHVELIALTDAVELAVFCGDVERRRFRFLRDPLAAKYADRLKHRLESRGDEAASR